jgi:hypothetical protein
MLTYRAEYDFACLYALRRPKLAREAARTALSAARDMRRPDLTYRVLELLSVI